MDLTLRCDVDLLKQIEDRDKFFRMFDDFESSSDLDDSKLIEKYHLTDVQLQALYHCLSERQMLLECLYSHYFQNTFVLRGKPSENK